MNEFSSTYIIEFVVKVNLADEYLLQTDATIRDVGMITVFRSCSYWLLLSRSLFSNEIEVRSQTLTVAARREVFDKTIELYSFKVVL